MFRFHRIISLLVPHWETATAPIGIDRLVRLQRLLNVLPEEDYSNDELCRVLCPIFAITEQEQSLFFSLFREIELDFESPDLQDAPKKLTTTSEEHSNKISTKKNQETTEKDSNHSTLNHSSTSRMILDYESATKPPFTWNIAPGNTGWEMVDHGDNFRRTLLQLRRRENARNSMIDIPASIKASITKAGMPNFRFKVRTRPAEYLLLVERFSVNDHRAGLFDTLYHTLRINQVYTERFFYDGDLRLCRNEHYPAGLHLYELRHKYPDARLLVLGSGYRFISPDTGALAKWITPVKGWNTRLLMTPVSRSKWGQRENVLSKVFTLLPADVQSLQFAAENPESGITAYDHLPGYLRLIAESTPIEIDDQVMRSLRRHFDPYMICWIAACAVYPGLNYDLTLALGKLLSETFGYQLTTAKNLLKIAQLPWFTRGRIPQEIREELVKYICQRHPEQYQTILGYLTALMEKNPPPEESVAWAAHKINLALLQAKTVVGIDKTEMEELREFLTVMRVTGPSRFTDFVIPHGWNIIDPNNSVDPVKEFNQNAIKAQKKLQLFIVGSEKDNGIVRSIERYLQEKCELPFYAGDQYLEYVDGINRDRQSIKAAINEADIFVLLISKALLRTSFFTGIEFQWISERADRRELKLLPLILENCDWKNNELGYWPCLPESGSGYLDYPYNNKESIDWSPLNYWLKSFAETLKENWEWPIKTNPNKFDSINSRDEYTVLILTPLPVEFESILPYLQDLQEPVIKDSAAYELGTFNGKHHDYTIVVREPGMRNVDMALATEKAIQHFQPDIILLVGIAGGVKDVRIGDVLVPKKVYGYESGKEDADGFKARPAVESFSGELLARAQIISRRPNWKQRTPDGAVNARVFFGPIAAGEKVVAGTANLTYERIKLHYNDTLGLEMEAIGFATALQGHRSLHGMAIRGISDLCEGKSETDKRNWLPVAAARAAAFAFELLYEMNPEEFITSSSKGTDALPPIPPKNPGRDALVQQLRTLIAAGRIKDAIPQLLEYTERNDPDIYTMVLQLSGDWGAFARKERMGLLANDEANVERSRIAARMLGILGEM